MLSYPDLWWSVASLLLKPHPLSGCSPGQEVATLELLPRLASSSRTPIRRNYLAEQHDTGVPLHQEVEQDGEPNIAGRRWLLGSCWSSGRREGRIHTLRWSTAIVATSCNILALGKPRDWDFIGEVYSLGKNKGKTERRLGTKCFNLNLIYHTGITRAYIPLVHGLTHSSAIPPTAQWATCSHSLVVFVLFTFS